MREKRDHFVDVETERSRLRSVFCKTVSDLRHADTGLLSGHGQRVEDLLIVVERFSRSGERLRDIRDGIRRVRSGHIRKFEEGDGRVLEFLPGIAEARVQLAHCVRDVGIVREDRFRHVRKALLHLFRGFSGEARFLDDDVDALVEFLPGIHRRLAEVLQAGYNSRDRLAGEIRKHSLHDGEAFARVLRLLGHLVGRFGDVLQLALGSVELLFIRRQLRSCFVDRCLLVCDLDAHIVGRCRLFALFLDDLRELVLVCVEDRVLRLVDLVELFELLFDAFGAVRHEIHRGGRRLEFRVRELDVPVRLLDLAL